jgi:uncharacterized membrane protein
MKHSQTMFVVVIVIFVSSCAHQQVSFKRDIKPILHNKCHSCHTSPDGSGYKATGLMLDSYESVMAGTVYGSIVVQGDSRRSILNMFAEGRTGDLQGMLKGNGKRLTSAEVEMLKYWVEQGALNN